MDNYEYIVASLPVIRQEDTRTDSLVVSELVDEIRGQLSGRDQSVLDQFLSGYDSEQLTEDFYHQAVEACRTGGYNAATYELTLPGIDSELWLAIWKDGHVDSGSPKSICDCLAR